MGGGWVFCRPLLLLPAVVVVVVVVVLQLLPILRG